MKKYIDKIKNHSGETFNIEGSVRSTDTESDVDLCFSDEVGKAILSMRGGHIKTKEFDSSDVAGLKKDSSSQNSDFEIKDVNDNVLVRFAYGNIETKNKANHTVEILMEGGDINADGINASTYSSFKGRSRTAFFINTNGASELICPFNGRVFMYDENHVLMNLGLMSLNLKLPLNNCCYIRMATSSSTIKSYSIKCGFNGTGCPYEEKLIAMRTPSERLLYHVDGEMFTAALMMLPPNYSPTGKKVPLILWDSGDGSYRNWNTYEMGTGYERRRIGLEYLRDQGFAVLEIYSWGSYYYNKYYNCGGRSAMGIPTHLKTHEKGVEYVCSRYNIDAENVFEISKSGSGKISLHYAIDKPNFSLKAIYAFAPVFDDLNFMGWSNDGYRKALYEELNLEGTEDQVDQFLNGTPKAKGGNGTSWVYFNPVPNAEGELDPEDSDDLAIYNANLQSNQAFIANNFHKFTKIVPGWMNLVGQTALEKLADTKNFAIAFWNNMSAVNTEPSNWSTNYTNYYEYFSEAGGYRKLTQQAEAPAFVAGKYFSFNQGDPTLENRIYTRHNLQMVGNHIPFTVIMAKNDEQTPYWNCLEVVNQLKNGGDEASIYTLPSQGHSAPDMGTVEQATDITTLCGQHYDAVSVGWYMACADIQKKYLAHIDKDVYDYVYQTT